jgi:hypothetical protein
MEHHLHPYPHHHHHHHQQHHQNENGVVAAGDGGCDGELMFGAEEWHDQLDLENHIRHCQCSCNHMGFGNYWSYKVTTSNL